MALLSLLLVMAAVVAAVVLVVGLLRPAWFGGAGRRRVSLVLGPVVAALVVAAVVLVALPSYEVAQASPEEPVVCGESTDLVVNVHNAGLTGGTYACTYSLDGVAQSEIELRVDGGADASVALPLPADLAPGGHTATLGDAIIAFTALRPAEFVVEYYDVSPTLLKPGQRIDVVAEVTNTGEVPGTFDGELRLGGEVVEAQPVEVEPGEVVDLEYEVRPENPGEYRLKLGDEQQKVVVVKPIRFANGEVIERHLGSGLGKLTLQNKKNDSDAVVVLTSTSSRKPLLAVYVRRKANCTVSGIPNGKYRVYYWIGRDWNRYMHGFLTTDDRGRYQDPLVYSTKSWTSSWTDAYYRYTQQNTEYTTWTLSLYVVYGGTAGVTSVSESDFPRVD
jgi:hypothetical protein